MSRQYKDGKKIEPKQKAPKRKSAEEIFIENNSALLLEKINLLKMNIADEFLDDSVRRQKIFERAIKLSTLHPFELLMQLAATEIHLETTLFLYDETFKTKNFLENEYLKLGQKRLIQAANKTAGKAKGQEKYTNVKEATRQILKTMNENDFKIFCKKMRAKLPSVKLPLSSLRKYYLEITGLKSTK